MYAIVEIGGKQYKAEKGAELLVDLMDVKEGAKVKFDTVTVLRNDKDIQIGTPYVEKATVEAKVESVEVKGDKLVIFKFKQKVPHRVKRGHRQKYTKITVTGIKDKGAKEE